MAGQLSYTYKTPKGIPGGLSDLNVYAIDSRINGEEKPGVLMYGTGAIRGNNPGVDVLLPTKSSSAEKFEGIVMTGFTDQRNIAGDVSIEPSQTVGVLRHGRAWVRVDPDVSLSYGDSLYLIADEGPTRGWFTNNSAGNVIPINGRFRGGFGTGSVAEVELYNPKSE